ncbi:hypothetical protein LCGC14_2680550 [marine sediment metagenome]|uniref:Uncharacterized protein n=1 Tax=marine sediment metagenome TaxID=412755 RepID=A0A0F9CD70_9ZZZZ
MGKIVGHVGTRDSGWYGLKSGKIVSVHITDNGTVFMSDSETWPSVTAEKLGIKYKLLVNASREQVSRFFEREGIELV